MLAVVYHTDLSGTHVEVVDAFTVRHMPEHWGVLSWHDTKEDAQKAMEEADVCS